MTLLESLIAREIVLCPKTQQPLRLSADGRWAQTAESRWPIRNGALDLYDGYARQQPTFDGNDDFTLAVARSLNLPLTAGVLSAVDSAVADTALRSQHREASAEIAELAGRLGVAGYATPAPASPVSLHNTGDVTITFERTFFEPLVRAGQRLQRSVRIRNGGSCTLSSEGHRPLFLSYHWLEVSGTVLLWDGLRSALPVPIEPSAACTVICDIQTPNAPGLYRLQFQCVIEGERWLEGGLLTVPVVVDDHAPSATVLHQTHADFAYEEDHAIGRHLVARHVKALNHAPRPTILEIGGGIHPQAASLLADVDVVSVDISTAMSQLGQIYIHNHRPLDVHSICFMAADAHALPFKTASLDGAVVFSALHHFADPVRLLSGLARTLKESGFIAIMCEPCMPNPRAEDSLRDLAKGINEQCWSVEEFAEIFLSSGLSVASGQINGGSLKVILKRRPGHPQTH